MHFTVSAEDQVSKAAVCNYGAVMAQHFLSQRTVSVYLEVLGGMHTVRDGSAEHNALPHKM